MEEGVSQKAAWQMSHSTELPIVETESISKSVPVKKNTKRDGIDRYGILWPKDIDDFSIELKCFGLAHPPEKGGLGRFQHLKNAIDLKWNMPRRMEAHQRGQYYDPDKHDTFIWNEWTLLMMRGFCEDKEVMVAGPGASWKTTCMGLYFLLFWLSTP
jgi:hypothetical protein